MGQRMLGTVGCSTSVSRLVALFTERTPGSDGDPRKAMLYHALRLRGRNFGPLSARELSELFRARHVTVLDYVRDVPYDACIEPLGNTYKDGFRLVINKAKPATRSRFSVAHEIFHTAFYELVPELKFLPHKADASEEYLCNMGATEMLMPAADVAIRDTDRPSLETLEKLAETYIVSVEAMLIRLRGLGFWKGCALSFWHRMSSNLFAVDRIYGDKDVHWEWNDERAITLVWENGHGSRRRGRGIVRCQDGSGIEGYKPVFYEMVNRRGQVIVLWSKRRLQTAVAKPLLFH